jgi:predicted CXXCH cytochrome family protein
MWTGLPEDRTKGLRYRPGDDLFETAELTFPVPSQGAPSQNERPSVLHSFWGDGTPHANGREYNGLFRSSCYRGGALSCISCHSMHASDPNRQIAAKMNGDEACLQCHTGLRQNPEKHTHHAATSAGSRCYNCHMPYIQYGLLKAARSHRIDSPSVRVDVETGRPNACNLCHLDRSLGWTQTEMLAWYGTPKVPMSEIQQDVAAGLVWGMQGSALVRAITAWHLGWADTRAASGARWRVPVLARLMEDPYSAVRYIAHRSLREIPEYRDFDLDYVDETPANARVRERIMQRWMQPDDLPMGVVDRAQLEQVMTSLSARRDDTPICALE